MNGRSFLIILLLGWIGSALFVVFVVQCLFTNGSTIAGVLGVAGSIVSAYFIRGIVKIAVPETSEVIDPRRYWFITAFSVSAWCIMMSAVPVQSEHYDNADVGYTKRTYLSEKPWMIDDAYKSLLELLSTAKDLERKERLMLFATGSIAIAAPVLVVWMLFLGCNKRGGAKVSKRDVAP